MREARSDPLPNPALHGIKANHAASQDAHPAAPRPARDGSRVDAVTTRATRGTDQDAPRSPWSSPCPVTEARKARGIRITGNRLTSGTMQHSATADGDDWFATWLPGWVLTRSHATTAMVLAQCVTDGPGDHTDQKWPRIEVWANELGLSGADAVGKISYYRVDLLAGE